MFMAAGLGDQGFHAIPIYAFGHYSLLVYSSGYNAEGDVGGCRKSDVH